jgi:CHAT domain-containing protein
MAAQLLVDARVDARARAETVRELGNLHRWAAYALARVRDTEGAALTLDAGRARELQRRIGRAGDDDVALAQMPAHLRANYQVALAQFVESPINAADTNAARRVGEAITAIRELPGLSQFKTGPTWADVVAAVEPRWPLVYINPTPCGTVLLLLHERNGTVQARAKFIDVTSTELYHHILVSGGDFEAGIREQRGSYFHAVVQGADDLGELLDELLRWLGPRLIAPVVSLLTKVGATRATLVLCGPIDQVPLHAAALDSSDETLGDRFELRYAPSAMACAVALERAEVTNLSAPRLVAVADPLGDLGAARAEIDEIAVLFGIDASTCRAGDEATLDFLREHGPDASHLHLACHARSGHWDATEAVLSLATGDHQATELTASIRLKARLVVASACQSAQSTLGNMLNAEFSIAIAFLAAGTACVIASLWPVDDLATALLMTRLYHELVTHEVEPPRALWSAQRWLRELSERDEQVFLDRHPHLAAEYARRLREGRRPGRHRGVTVSRTSGIVRPYADPAFWAPFIAIGV